MARQTSKNTTFFQALHHAYDGVVYSLKTEKNMRSHVILAILVILLGVCLQVSALEWLWLLQCISFIFFAELINSVIETVIDAMTQQQYFTWAKHAKDMASGAVLICAIYSAIVGAIIFVPKLLSIMF